MRRAVIKSVGAYVPPKVLTNEYFNELLGEDVDTWLRENLTIKERHWCGDNESTADLAVEAGKTALQRSGLRPEEIDLIIITTDTPEYISPSTASVIQYRLNAVNAGTFDVNTACAGFVTGLDIAAKYIRADENYHSILVVGAYAMSKYLDMADKKTVTLFADGAGAVVLTAEKSGDRGFLSSKLYTEGQYSNWMGIYTGGTKSPSTPEKILRKDHSLKFVKKIPKKINPQIWTKMISKVCKSINIPPEEIDHYFFTQININAIWETLDNLGADRKKGYTIMDRFGYTGSACIPMALNDVYEKNMLKKGDNIIFMGSGGGLAFACAAFKW